MTPPIAYGPADYKEMVDAVFTPNPRFPYTPMTGGAIGKVYRIETQQPFVVKINPGFDAQKEPFQAQLSEVIATPVKSSLFNLHSSIFLVPCA